MKKKQGISNHFLQTLYDVIYAAITLMFIKYVKQKHSFKEILQKIAQEFGINLVDFVILKESLKAEAAFFKKLKSKYAKTFIPPSLQDLACEVRMLYLYFLSKFSKDTAKMWAILYGLCQPAFLHNPFPIGILVLTEAIAIRRIQRFFTRKKLEEAFERLKTKGILRGEKMTFDELLSCFEVEESKIVSNYILSRYETEKDKQELKKKRGKIILI